MKIHIFDTISPEPTNGTQVTVHCGKSLTAKPLTGQESIKKCAECFRESDQFMKSHPNVFVHTIFVGEES